MHRHDPPLAERREHRRIVVNAWRIAGHFTTVDAAARTLPTQPNTRKPSRRARRRLTRF
ncbi:MAG: hypothetical protein WCR51_12430 [Planctomycetia bacterium]